MFTSDEKKMWWCLFQTGWFEPGPNLPRLSRASASGAFTKNDANIKKRKLFCGGKHTLCMREERGNGLTGWIRQKNLSECKGCRTLRQMSYNNKRSHQVPFYIKKKYIYTVQCGESQFLPRHAPSVLHVNMMVGVRNVCLALCDYK